ncbi:MAG: hypothetical protein ACSHW0_01435 [Thalassotalea sp.]
MNLATHGSYKLSKTENILVVEAQGPFDEATINQYLSDIKALIEDIKHEPWGTLAIFSGNSIFTPDAEQALIEITRQRAQNNMIAIATVIKESYQADLQQMQLGRVYQACNISHNFFSSEQMAKNWLSGFLNVHSEVG